jgi:hypothetical protein
MINTANKIPQIRNHRLAFSPIVERTSALIIALSILLIISNRQRPATVRIIKSMSMHYADKVSLINISIAERHLFKPLLICLFYAAATY